MSPAGARAPSVDNVLLVEDDMVTREVVLLLLRRLGYRADVAGNGVEALAAVHAVPYDLVLMDVHMPEMDGMEATCRIRAEVGAGLQPTVIAMTAGVSADERTLCLEAGVDGFLSKPVHVEDLAAVLGGRPGANPATVTSARDVRNAPVYDPGLLDALVADLGVEGETVRKDLIETYLAEGEHTVAALTEAGRNADGDALAFTAHALKSASATLGLTALSIAAAAIETTLQTAPEQMDVALAAAELVAEHLRGAAALGEVLEADPGRPMHAEPARAATPATGYSGLRPG
jgi:CheY-like chemotaxis protein